MYSEFTRKLEAFLDELQGEMQVMEERKERAVAAIDNRNAPNGLSASEIEELIDSFHHLSDLIERKIAEFLEKNQMELREPEDVEELREADVEAAFENADHWASTGADLPQ